MKRTLTLLSAAFLTVTLFPLQSRAEDLGASAVFAVGQQDDIQYTSVSHGKDDGEGWCCPSAGGAFADVELNFMKYGKENGNFGLAGPAEFGYELTPRVTLGYQSSGGLGVRTRIWDFSHTTNSTGSMTDDVYVDAFVWDLELFERVDLNCNTSIEWGGGLRYTDYTENINFPVAGNFMNTEGFGGVVGLQLNRYFAGGEIYGRGRFAMMLAEDGNRIVAGTAQDIWTSQTEIGVGYEMVRELRSGRLARLRLGYEWQQWDGFGDNHFRLHSPTAIGFAGFVIGAGLDY